MFFMLKPSAVASLNILFNICLEYSLPLPVIKQIFLFCFIILIIKQIKSLSIFFPFVIVLSISIHIVLYFLEKSFKNLFSSSNSLMSLISFNFKYICIYWVISIIHFPILDFPFCPFYSSINLTIQSISSIFIQISQYSISRFVKYS